MNSWDEGKQKKTPKKTIVSRYKWSRRTGFFRIWVRLMPAKFLFEKFKTPCPGKRATWALQRRVLHSNIRSKQTADFGKKKRGVGTRLYEYDTGRACSVNAEDYTTTRFRDQIYEASSNSANRPLPFLKLLVVRNSHYSAFISAHVKLSFKAI